MFAIVALVLAISRVTSPGTGPTLASFVFDNDRMISKVSRIKIYRENPRVLWISAMTPSLLQKYYSDEVVI
jgi:hypothetical protein